MKKVPFAVLCLTCGEKLCYMKDCCKNYGKNKNQYEYVYHNRICLNGEGIYLQLFDGEILASLNGNFVPLSINIYLNKYRESFKGKNISQEYKLDEERMKNILSDFKTMKLSRYFRAEIEENNDIDLLDEDDY